VAQTQQNLTPDPGHPFITQHTDPKTVSCGIFTPDLYKQLEGCTTIKALSSMSSLDGPVKFSLAN
jgi:hypothetical protein